MCKSWQARVVDAPCGHVGRGALSRLRVYEGHGRSVFHMGVSDREGVPGVERKVIRLGHRCGVSGRELEVMLLLVQGRSAARIADSLGVSAATVNSHVHHMYRKIGVHSRQELLDMVEQEGPKRQAPSCPPRQF